MRTFIVIVVIKLLDHFGVETPQTELIWLLVIGIILATFQDVKELWRKNDR